MNDIGAGLGTFAEGSLLARALDPASGARERDPHQPDNCLNCETALVGAYCHACGQDAHVHRSLGGVMHDLLHGALHFEGRLWHTLPMLVLRPGSLTRRYIAGERARFVSPMALFLFSVFLMFAVFQALGITTPVDVPTQGEVTQGIDAVRAQAAEELADARADYQALPAGDPGRAAAQERLEDAESAASGLEALRTPGVSADGEAAEDTSLRLEGLEGLGWFSDKLIEKWREHPDLMLYKLQSNSYKFSWLLIPLSIPFVWLLFAWKRRYNAYDHAIFVTYSLSFMSLLFVAISLGDAAGVSGDALGLAGMIVPPLHIYKQMKGAYGLSRVSALWRLAALGVMIFIVLLLFVQILLVLGAF